MQRTRPTLNPAATGKTRSARGYLVSGLLASLVAASCCIGPFFLLATGISAAWMSQVMLLEPLRPVFSLLAILFTVVAGWKTFRVSARPGEQCSRAGMAIHTRQKQVWLLTAALIVVLLASAYWIELLF